MRCGCIDIGSNTTRLLVAEPAGGTRGVRVLARERVFLPLTGLECGELREGLIDELVAAVSRLAGLAAAQGVGEGRLRAVATQALRALPAGECNRVVGRLEAFAGVPVELLTPRREAALAFAGATAGRDERLGRVAVVDVGGGSTELIVGRPCRAPEWWISVPLGSRVLTERHLPDDPPSRQQIDAARADARAAFTVATPPLPVVRAWTVGGGTTALARLLAGRPAEPGLLDDVLGTLTSAPAAEVAAAHGLEPERTRMLPAALILLATVIAPLGRGVEPGGGGVREGVIAELAGGRGAAGAGL